ncbi:heparinase II/III-family protein [Sphingomicrobium flavum]|uniref:heparinase II/III-family protein n=1 Tax=Sphingomicrobium flavum TaxID=1229164 RepID=UPI0021ADB77D|nr:heparinase II/III-family protein [Sphingomicrobium flavum]
MSGWPAKLRTYRKLGLANLWRVGSYRLGLKQGWHPVLKIDAQAPDGPFFRSAKPDLPFAPRADWQQTMPWFGWTEKPLGDVPDWHLSPQSGAHAASDRPWHQIGDFDPALGDIKAVWEASRWDWLLAMATRGETERINDWIADWLTHNPPFEGVNWKCGQEASIRVMHMALAAVVLGQDEAPEPGLAALLKLHLRRIAPTMNYAIGQANNHGTSEAAALFIGGSWLDRLGDGEGAAWARTGRRWLEERAHALIAEDGTFSQYSLVYHRVMLDTYCLVELWRRRWKLAAFSGALHRRLDAATRWLQQMVQANGDGPNFGANDGARLIALTDGPYRDFRPTLQSSAILFCDRVAIVEQGPWDRLIALFGQPRPSEQLPAPKSRIFPDGGLAVLRTDRAVAFVRFGRFDHRPSQADLMHVDLWVDGENLLRDDGSFSYADDAEGYGSASMHNSVTFDGRDPMPRVSRFLWGDWVEAEVGEIRDVDGEQSIRFSHRDANGNRHERTITLSHMRLICRDMLSGKANSATLRWRLPVGDYDIHSNTIQAEGMCMGVNGDTIDGPCLVDSVESRHYFNQQPVKVLEVTCQVPGQLETSIRF